MMLGRARFVSLHLLTQRGFSTIPESLQPAFGYCIHQARTYDRDNYAWCAQLPKEHRAAFFALRAFNIETGLVADVVKSGEGGLMSIRYQWWRDAISSAAKQNPPNHPVAVALSHVMQSVKLNRYQLKRIVDTREGDALEEQPPLGTDGLEQYAEGTASQLMYLQLQALGVQSRDADHAASHLGKAIGITTLLRGTPHHAVRRRSYLPVELCAKHGVSQEDIYRGNVTAGLKDVALEVASVAKGHLDEARELCGNIPQEGRAAFLPAIAVDQYLQALESKDFDLFDSSLQPDAAPSLKYTLRLKWHMMRKTF